MKSPGTVLGLTALLGLVAIYVRVESLAGHARPRRAPAARASHADTPQVPRLASAKGSSDLEQRIADLERELEESPSPDTTPATGPTELATFAEQLQLTDPQKRQVEATVTRYGDLNVRITCSIGIAQADARDSALQLFEFADQALYMAKESGRIRVQVHEVAREPSLA